MKLDASIAVVVTGGVFCRVDGAIRMGLR